jgi:eukaryotic-like serine/threonine-protein kinase
VGPGRTVGGRYRIVERIGRGGHGEVHRAQQLPLGRDVALKLLSPEAYAGEGPERFVREASLVQALDHPNTVRLYDFGIDDAGFPFMAFELLRGRTLEQEIEKGPLPPDRVARIATQILKALMDAHARGIIHRDIKPSNVFLVDFAGEKDFVKVLDFGVARRAVESTTQPKITSDGQIVGTPAYMAPEQVKDEPIGPSTDLYSLGLVIAEALSGEMVVRGSSEAAIWMKQASSAPIDVPPRVLASAFGPVVLTATNKDPTKRYASAAEMLRAVEQAMTAGAAPTDPLAVPLAHPMPRAMPPPTPPAPMSKWPFAVIAIAVTVVAMLFIVSTTFVQQAKTVRIDATATTTTATATGEIVAPPMLPVVEKVTRLGWKLARALDPQSFNGLVVVTAVPFE